MRREDRFEYRKARPNRFASRMQGEPVNSLLRSGINALPKRAKA